MRTAAPSNTRPSAHPPQRDLPGRGRRTADQQLLSLGGRVTERDRELCRLLHQHRVFTTGQITDLAFTGARKTRQRLSTLYQLTVLDRFRPRAWAGSAPHHWILGPAGAAILAAEAGVDLHTFGWQLDTTVVLGSRPRLHHLLGTNGFFTALTRTARATAGCQLADWWSARRCENEWGEVVSPDGYGVWAEAGRRLPFLLEYDLANERLEKLTAKLAAYARFHRAVGHPTWICYRFPTPSRETEARRALIHPGTNVATAVLAPGADPSAKIWLPIGSHGPRRRLIELGQPGPIPTS